MFEHVADVLPAILSSFVSFMFLRSTGIFSKKEGKDAKETSYNPKNEADRVHLFLEELAKGNFEVKETNDLSYRNITVKGMKDIEVIWMGGWERSDTFIVEKEHYKRYLYYSYNQKTKNIERVNPSGVLDVDFLEKSGLFTREWTSVEAQHLLKATQMVSLYCRGEIDGEKKKKEQVESYAKNLEFRCQEIKPLQCTTKEGVVKNVNIPSVCQDIWQKIEAEAEQIITQHELSIEDTHNIGRWLKQGNQLILQYQQLAPAQRQQEEQEIVTYLHKILHTLETMQTEKMQVVYQEFEKTKRIIQETH